VSDREFTGSGQGRKGSSAFVGEELAVNTSEVEVDKRGVCLFFGGDANAGYIGCRTRGGDACMTLFGGLRGSLMLCATQQSVCESRH